VHNSITVRLKFGSSIWGIDSRNAGASEDEPITVLCHETGEIAK